MKKISLKTWIDKIRLVALRFPFTLIFLCGLAFYLLLEINNHNFEIQQRIWAMIGLGLALTTSLSLYSEQFKNRLLRIGLHIVAIAALSFYIYSLPENLLPFHIFQLIIIGIAFILSVFVVSFLKKNNDVPFWEFSKTITLQLLISFIFAQVLMVGLSLAILSLNELFNVNIKTEVYSNLAVFCYVIFAPIYFLVNVPSETEKRKQEYTFNKFIKILGLYIFLPILAVYSLILYVYLAQIIVKWELPNGWVSGLISTLAMGGFISMLILYPMLLEKENKIVKVFSRYFPLLLLPLLILMSVGIFRRIEDYGLTINRSYVIILNLWFYGISIYLFLSKANHLKWIVISFVTVAFLSSVGPWSVFAVTKNSVKANLEKSLSEAYLLNNGKVILPVSKKIVVDTILQIKIIENIRYLSSNYGNESFEQYFSRLTKDKTTSVLFEELNLNENIQKDIDIEYFSANLTYKSMNTNVQPHKNFVRIIISENIASVYNNKDLTIKYDKKNQTIIVKNATKNLLIPLTEKISNIKTLYFNNLNREFSNDELTIKTDDYLLIINSLNGEVTNQNNFKINSLEAFLFY